MAEENDSKWQKGKSLAECNWHLLDNNIDCDITFTVSVDNQESRQIQAHKFILSSRSPVFSALFKEDVMKGVQEVAVSDVDPDIFMNMLEYMYTDEADLEPATVVHLKYAAAKYEVSSLEKECEDYIKKENGRANTPILLAQANYYNDTDLAAECMKYVCLHTQDIFTSEFILQIPSDILSNMLEAEFITCSEAVLFNACYKWAQKKCEEQEMEKSSENIRKTLGSLLFKIRLPYASAKEFHEIVKTEVLESREEAEIWRYITGIKLSRQENSTALPLPERFPKDDRVIHDNIGTIMHHHSRSLNCKNSMKFVFQIKVQGTFPISIDGVYVPKMPYDCSYSIYYEDKILFKQNLNPPGKDQQYQQCMFSSPITSMETNFMFKCTVEMIVSGPYVFGQAVCAQIDPDKELIFKNKAVEFTVTFLESSVDTIQGIPLSGIIFSIM